MLFPATQHTVTLGHHCNQPPPTPEHAAAAGRAGVPRAGVHVAAAVGDEDLGEVVEGGVLAGLRAADVVRQVRVGQLEVGRGAGRAQPGLAGTPQVAVLTIADVLCIRASNESSRRIHNHRAMLY